MRGRNTEVLFSQASLGYQRVEDKSKKGPSAYTYTYILRLDTSKTLTEVQVPSTAEISGGMRIYATGEKYLLPVDKQEGSRCELSHQESYSTRLPHPTAPRLELQHKVLKTTYEGQLLLAPHAKDASYFVLEIGTGTGERDPSCC